MKVFLIFFGFFLGFFGCGTEHNGTSEKRPGTVSTGQQTTICDVNGDNCRTTTAIQTVGVGESAPSSYTFLVTPNANLCADAFLRQGVTLPVDTVARSFNSFNVRAGGIAWQDMGAESIIPVMTILNLSSKFSDVTFQLLNPVGYYCIVKNDAVFSNVTLQRRCSAQIAYIEPMTTVTINQPPVKRGFCGFRWPWQRYDDGANGATTSSFNSQINESPCIP